MNQRNVLNIVNFLRTVEPRERYSLTAPVYKQLKLLKQHALPHTFLLQYDVLCSPAYLQILRDGYDAALTEYGVWLEIVQPLAEDAGLPWRGKQAVWDWHANVGFSVGYEPAVRETLIDVLFEKFKTVFGYYPRVMGSWTIDAHTLSYAAERYGLDASCNCKDQWGTDGYTVWGGYWNGAYYPAKRNMFCPAQSKAEQISVPLFRMLGSDPIYQYDEGLSLQDGGTTAQRVITLEPSCDAGSNPKWIDWFLHEMYENECLGYAYAQAGQENAFGWRRMKVGLPYQFAQFAKLREQGLLQIETLGESGRWFQGRYDETPATSIVSYHDWKQQGCKTVWYNCKNYRANVLIDGTRFWIRDMFLFRDQYAERYLTQTEPSQVLRFDNLPLMDGNRMSGGGIRAGIYCYNGEQELHCVQFHCENTGEDSIRVTFSQTEIGDVVMHFSPDALRVIVEPSDVNFRMLAKFSTESTELPTLVAADENTLQLKHNGFSYSVSLTRGRLQNFNMYPIDGEICLRLNA